MSSLLDDLCDRYIKEESKDDAADQLRRFVEYCKVQIATKRIIGVQYNQAGQACLMYEDGSINALGNPTAAVGGIQSSYAFTQQPRQLTAPMTIEAPAISFTKQP